MTSYLTHYYFLEAVSKLVNELHNITLNKVDYGRRHGTLGSVNNFTANLEDTPVKGRV